MREHAIVTSSGHTALKPDHPGATPNWDVAENEFEMMTSRERTVSTPRGRERRYDGGCSARTLAGNVRQIGIGRALVRGRVIGGVHLRLYRRAHSVSRAEQPLVRARD